ncbi:MAG TPA: DUF1553 domain-containing protein [Bryobacteraceae bacterium]|nr:DUF1553 domain-containing protein [Bryobacteraceae bacterium]
MDLRYHEIIAVNVAPFLYLLAAGAYAAPVEFNRDIRPILSDRCFICHGPDAGTRKIKLRLDSEAAMLADLGGHKAVTPGDAEASELVKRITADKPALRMPPPYSGLKLNAREIELLRQWVREGAKWQKHWSLIPPARPDLPAVQNKQWPLNPIDRFVLARLEREGMQPSKEADRATLIRRVSLDLTGIPPTPAEVDAFINDPASDAYEKVVDRFLTSHRYGERMAARWLDAARYADTNGYQSDGERMMWRWRDWVIQAFNKNKPFDEFTVEQLAGDLLPGSTTNQKIATAFNRNHRGNGEGGIVPEEYMVEYAADRMETMSTVWLGSTIGCARCHNHKYDPFTQKDYYQLFAYFNNIADRGRYFKYGNTPPFMPAPTPEEQAKLDAMDRKLSDAEKRYQDLDARIESSLRDWVNALPNAKPADWAVSRGLVAAIPQQTFDGSKYYDAGKLRAFGYLDSFSISAWINPAAPTGAIVTKGKDVAEEAGIGLVMQNGKLQLNLVLRWLDDSLRVETRDAIPLNKWQHVVATYDSSRLASGIRIYVDGREMPLKILVDELNQDFRTAEPWRIGGGFGKDFLFRGSMDEVRIYGRKLNAEEAGMLGIRDSLNQLASRPARSKAEQSKLRFAFLEEHADAEIRQAWKERNDLREQRERLIASFPTVMVMEEMPKVRDTFLLVRGAYDKPGERVTPNVPAVLPRVADGMPNNRLALARWMVDPANPLTSRVIVNRFWQTYFGTGLVKTVEDFGSQGEWPSHPDLLDWLAVQFSTSGWDVKAIQKMIVMSATYRQTSRAAPDLQQKDPENRLLARGPRMRLPAETVRDQALAISGLLVERTGGPSVKPYQPAGLWKELTGGADYERDKGPALYRRSLYTFWKRTSPPPAMMNFDAAGRETCIVRENRTNTPLQALNLMNDVTYLEASRKMAERMMLEGGATPADRLAYGFKLATSRNPRGKETEVLLDSFRHQLDLYQTDRGAAAKLLSQGDSPSDSKLNASELAAYATVASLILNLDETITKQ